MFKESRINAPGAAPHRAHHDHALPIDQPIDRPADQPADQPAGRCCCYIIPPHMQEHIATNGSVAQKLAAIRSMALSGFMRGMRVERALIGGGVSTLQKRRTIYDAKQRQTLPGTLVRGERNAATKDVAVNEAYDGSGNVYDFFMAAFGRNSIDGKGLRLDSTVHYGRRYDNAFWNGQQMVYGDGDGSLFNRFTISLDVIGHELTHGVTQYEAALEYQDEPGALNESMSDVFGSLVKQWRLKQTADKADWLIGAGLLAKGVKGVALRSMIAPGTAYDDPALGKDPQPAHMKDYYKGQEDNGGVHINSGIPNLAFATTARQLGGAAWQQAGKIWYTALCSRLGPSSGFHDARVATLSAALDLYGKTSKEYKAVKAGWDKVGVK